MKRKEHLITAVEQGSIAEELNIETGDLLISINGQTLKDALDYHLLIETDVLEVLIEKGTTKEQWLLDIEKEETESLGLIFESNLMDCYESCHNKCMFCFIDQLPKGLRPTLYFKDDDARLSFLQGNYITMTNMKDQDVDRIIRYHLTPINISIHTMDLELRKKMLNNRFADRIKIYMDKLNEHDIIMNGQIVLCKGVNDSEHLEYTISQLEPYVPNMQSLSIVPVGLSRFREGLYPLEPFTKEDAIALIKSIYKWQQHFMERFGLHFVHLSDEFYLLAETDMPLEASYDGYLQLENGVGMSRLFIDNFRNLLEEDHYHVLSGKIDVITGTLFAENMTQLAQSFMETYPDTTIVIHPIVNDFFGHRITVSGLLTGTDLIKQLKDIPLSDRILLPSNILKAEEDILLDDISVGEIEEALKVKIQIVEVDGEDFYNHLIDLLKV